MTIDSMKHAICGAEGIPVDQQRVIFEGRQMEDDRTLDAYGVGPDATVHLVLRLRGGMMHFSVRFFSLKICRVFVLLNL